MEIELDIDLKYVRYGDLGIRGFCPTGEGGGVDNSCSPGRGGDVGFDEESDQSYDDEEEPELYQGKGPEVDRSAEPGGASMDSKGWPEGSELKWDYPQVGETVDGREVLANVDNQSSIESSLSDWDELPGIRDVPMSHFNAKNFFYSADDIQKSKDLAAKIEHSGRVSPLIVVVDKKGPYILEGGHRFYALHQLKAKSFPAKVVIDTDTDTGFEEHNYK